MTHVQIVSAPKIQKQQYILLILRPRYVCTTVPKCTNDMRFIVLLTAKPQYQTSESQKFWM